MDKFKRNYLRRKEVVLSDPAICEQNRDLFKRFFAYEEYKLQRQNQLLALDEACYKTLYAYLGYLTTVNQWFANKPWVDLTKEDIKRVYDGLEDGVIRNARGGPMIGRRSYYNKIFRSKPFEMAGKAQLVKEVMEFYVSRNKHAVQFIDEENFLKIVGVLRRADQLLLCWLAWDIGENINSLLQLQKRDFMRRTDPATGEAEYVVNLPVEKLKRSRTPRSEPTMCAQTVRYLDMLLPQLSDQDPVFTFEHRQALKFLKAACRRSGAKGSPHGQSIRWKDFRSGMACHMLRKGCSLEEVNARLGHKPSSRQIDAYVTFLALDRRKPKQTFMQSNLREMEQKLEAVQQHQHLTQQRVEMWGQQNEQLRLELAQALRYFQELRRIVEAILQGRYGSSFG